MIPCCPRLQTWLRGPQGVGGTWGVVLLHRLVGCGLMWLQEELSQACSRYGRQQAVGLCWESKAVLSLRCFSGVPVIASLAIVGVCWVSDL